MKRSEVDADLHFDKTGIALYERTLQPFERRVNFAARAVNLGDLKRRLWAKGQ